MRTAVYVRLEDPRHALLMEYAKAHQLTLNDVIERLVDQLLVQVAPQEFRAPQWLVAAVSDGHIPLCLPEETYEDEVDLDGKVVNLRGRR